MTNSYFAVQTRPAAEYVAKTEMLRVGLDVYLPQYRREEQHRRSHAWIAKQFPLFPGYLFLAAESLRWPALTSCNGLDVDPVLCNCEGKPIPIDGEVIRRIRDNEECGAFDVLRSAPGRLQIGDSVTIADGALAGLIGPLSRVRNHRHIEILSALFGGSKVTAPLTALTKSAA
jgi:transcription antitermination factor NusG